MRIGDMPWDEAIVTLVDSLGQDGYGQPLTAEEVRDGARELIAGFPRSRGGRGVRRPVKLVAHRGRPPAGYRANCAAPARCRLDTENVLRLVEAARTCLLTYAIYGRCEMPRGGVLAALAMDPGWRAAHAVVFAYGRQAVESGALGRSWRALVSAYRTRDSSLVVAFDHDAICAALARRWVARLASVSVKRVRDLQSAARPTPEQRQATARMLRRLERLPYDDQARLMVEYQKEHPVDAKAPADEPDGYVEVDFPPTVPGAPHVFIWEKLLQ